MLGFQKNTCSLIYYRVKNIIELKIIIQPFICLKVSTDLCSTIYFFHSR